MHDLASEHAEDELLEEPPADTSQAVDPEEPENEAFDTAELSLPLFGALNVTQLTGILTLAKEVETANRPGRKTNICGE